MAIVWGSTVGSNRGFRVGIEFTQTAITDTTVTIRADYYIYNELNVSDSNNSFAATGSMGNISQSLSISGTGTRLLTSQTNTFTREFGHAVIGSQDISLTGLEFFGLSSIARAQATFSVPARPYATPAAPTNLKVFRSGTTMTASWTNNHSTNPAFSGYASEIVVTGFYQAAGESSEHAFTRRMSNTATSVTINSVGNRAVTLSVAAANSTGTGTVWSGWTYRRPPAPTITGKVRPTQTSAGALWRNNHSTDPASATYAPEIRIQVNALRLDGTWEHIKTDSVSGSYTAREVTGLTANRAYSLGVYAVNGQSGESAKAWTGAIYPVPVAPTSCTSARNSDTRNTVSWSSTVPRYQGTSHLIERSTSGGTWIQIASVPASTTSYVDNGTTANNWYRYRVRTAFGDKRSGYATSGITSNTPGTPSNATASVRADKSVDVRWTDNSRSEAGFEVQRSLDGGTTWAQVYRAAEANITSWIDMSPPAGSVRYRVRAWNAAGDSGWSTTSSITTIAPPLAPTISQRPAAFIEHGQSVQMGWVHNPVDGSDQTAFEVLVDEGLSSQRVISGVSSKSISAAAGEPGAHTLKVRTKGAHADWSPYSQTVTYTVAMPPQITITSPATDGEVITALPYTTSWTYDGAGYDPVRVDYYIQRQEEDGSWTTVYLDQTVAGNGSVTLDADTVIPRNGQTYRVHMWTRAASGLTTMSDRVFTTDYVEPAQPVVTVDYDPDRLSASVSVEDGTPIGDEVMPVSYTILRITDEDEVVLADHAMSGTTVTDPIPPLNRQYVYRVVAHAASGAISETDYPVTIHGLGRFALNYGVGFMSVASLDANAEVSRTPQKSQELAAYQGRSRPVLHHNPYTEHELRLSGDIFPATDEAIAQWEGLEDWYAEAVYRDNRGNVTLVSTQLSWIEPRGSDIPSVEVSMVEVVLP